MGEGATMSVFFAGVSAAASIAAGAAQQAAFNTQASAQEEEGNLKRAEAQEEAIRIEKERKEARAKVGLAFIKGGVTLQFTPLDLIEEQEREDEQEAYSIRKRGYAQQKLAFANAQVSRSRGRAALLGGIAGGASTMAQALK